MLLINFLQRSLAILALSLTITFAFADHGLGQQAAATVASKKYEKAIAASRKAANQMLADSKTPGCQVAVSVDGQLIWTEGFGFANLETKTRTTAETRFGIGSISKSLTTALLLKLQDGKQCDIDRPLQHYLPDFPRADAGITPRSVAGHLSGLDDAFGTANRYNTRHFESTQAALAEIYRDGLKYPPGQRHFYATGTYTLLAGVIEKQTGMDFLAAMDRLLRQPLKLNSVVPNRRTDIIDDRSAFYERQQGQLINAPYFDPSYKWAGAGYLATAADINRFADEVFFGDYLSAAAKAMLVEDQLTAAGKKTGFGLGWRMAQDSEGRRLYHQPGGGPGISCWVFVFPDQRFTVSILSNLTAAPVGGKLADVVTESFLEIIESSAP